jgi:hypothetical protein
MGMARDIERRLEGMMEGFFSKLFRSGLQPVEVGRRILRDMDEGKTISVNRVYAPNDFRVYLGPDDYTRFSSMEAGLVREFSDLVIDAAKEHRWNLMGMPKIAFQQVEDLGKGEFRVDASLTADPDAPPMRASTHEADANDPSATAAISSHTAERLGMLGSQAKLVVLDDSGSPKEEISITKSPVTIGRLSSNDVVIPDSNVSRRHAELRRQGSHWVVVDAGSTNGTLVNGKIAKEHTLSDGDRLGFGKSELLFRLAKGT